MINPRRYNNSEYVYTLHRSSKSIRQLVTDIKGEKITAKKTIVRDLRGKQDGRIVVGHGVYLSPWMHQENISDREDIAEQQLTLSRSP